MIRVTVWNEFRHEKTSKEIARLYPKGIHGTIAAYLKQHDDMKVRTATLDQPEHGLSERALAATDVIVWWGHIAHGEVSEEVVNRLHARVLEGMGLIVLHSAIHSRIFLRLMGTSCNLKWRESGEKERLWVIEPGHRIAQGLPEYIEIPHTEMYGERFDIPAPDDLVFVSWFPGGEVFRSGCCFNRGAGKVFYFRPGHETLPIYHNEEVLRVIANAVRWAAPVRGPKVTHGNVKALEEV